MTKFLISGFFCILRIFLVRRVVVWRKSLCVECGIRFLVWFTWYPDICIKFLPVSSYGSTFFETVSNLFKDLKCFKNRIPLISRFQREILILIFLILSLYENTIPLLFSYVRSTRTAEPGMISLMFFWMRFFNETYRDLVNFLVIPNSVTNWFLYSQ